jgi:hypothetical protein
MTLTIKIEELELLLTKTIKKLKEEKYKVFSFGYDEYWIITTDFTPIHFPHIQKFPTFISSIFAVAYCSLKVILSCNVTTRSG